MNEETSAISMGIKTGQAFNELAEAVMDAVLDYLNAHKEEKSVQYLMEKGNPQFVPCADRVYEGMLRHELDAAGIFTVPFQVSGGGQKLQEGFLYAKTDHAAVEKVRNKVIVEQGLGQDISLGHLRGAAGPEGEVMAVRGMEPGLAYRLEKEGRGLYSMAVQETKDGKADIFFLPRHKNKILGTAMLIEYGDLSVPGWKEYEERNIDFHRKNHAMAMDAISGRINGVAVFGSRDGYPHIDFREGSAVFAVPGRDERVGRDSPEFDSKVQEWLLEIPNPCAMLSADFTLDRQRRNRLLREKYGKPAYDRGIMQERDSMLGGARRALAKIDGRHYKTERKYALFENITKNEHDVDEANELEGISDYLALWLVNDGHNREEKARQRLGEALGRVRALDVAILDFDSVDSTIEEARMRAYGHGGRKEDKGKEDRGPGFREGPWEAHGREGRS